MVQGRFTMDGGLMPQDGPGSNFLASTGLSLTSLEAGIGFANHIDPAAPFDDLAIGVAGLGGFQ